MENLLSIFEKVVSNGEAFEKLYHFQPDKSIWDNLFEDMGRSYAIEPKEAKLLCFEVGFPEALYVLTRVSIKKLVSKMEGLRQAFPAIKQAMDGFLTEHGKGRVPPRDVDVFLLWFVKDKGLDLLHEAVTRVEIPDITESDFIKYSEYKREEFSMLEKAFRAHNEPESPTFEALFASLEYAEKTLNVLQELGIITRSNNWNYGEKKGAICALVAVLKKRKWFIFESTDFETAQIIAKKIGTNIGKQTVSDYASSPPKYAANLIVDFGNLLKD